MGVRAVETMTASCRDMVVFSEIYVMVRNTGG